MFNLALMTRQLIIPVALTAMVFAQEPQNDGDRRPDCIASNTALEVIDSRPQVESAALVKSVIPDYPTFARVNRIRGAVTLMANVNTEGRVTNVKAFGGPPVFIPSTVAAIRQWVYRPALVDGIPANTSMVIRVNFFVP